MVDQSLRAALGADRDPEFAMMLPEGWIRLDADDAARDELLERVRARLMGAHRPDLWAAARTSVTEAFARAHDSSAGRWRRDLSPEQLADVEREAGAQLVALGYALSSTPA